MTARPGKGKQVYTFPDDFTVLDIEANTAAYPARDADYVLRDSRLCSSAYTPFESSRQSSALRLSTPPSKTVRVCEIIEIGALKYRGGALVDTYSTLVKPSCKIDSYVSHLTGITDEMTENAPSIQTAIAEFCAFAGSDVILGYNVNFDINCIYDALSLCYGKPFSNNYVDVLTLTRRALKDVPNHKQTTVAEYFGLDVSGAHRAVRDCELCAEIYYKIRRSL